MKLCPADEIQNFKRVKITHIWQNEDQRSWNFLDGRHVLPLTCSQAGI